MQTKVTAQQMKGNKHRVGIIGQGNVGTNLRDGLTRAGYPVETCGHDAKEVERVAADSDILFFAVPNDQVENVIKESNGNHKGKIIVDVSNVMTEDMEFAGSLEESNAERLQRSARDAKVVKAFNTVFADNMSSGQVNGDRLSVFIAGDDEKSKTVVKELAEAIGFDAVDTGPLKNARYLEALGFLNIQLGFKQEMGTDIGFKLVHG